MADWKLQLTHFQRTHLELHKQKPHEINYKQIDTIPFDLCAGNFNGLCSLLFCSPDLPTTRRFEKLKMVVYFPRLCVIKCVALSSDICVSTFSLSAFYVGYIGWRARKAFKL